jgi:hypothetical protein
MRIRPPTEAALLYRVRFSSAQLTGEPAFDVICFQWAGRSQSRQRMVPLYYFVDRQPELRSYGDSALNSHCDFVKPDG